MAITLIALPDWITFPAASRNSLAPAAYTVVVIVWLYGHLLRTDIVACSHHAGRSHSDPELFQVHVGGKLLPASSSF